MKKLEFTLRQAQIFGLIDHYMKLVSYTNNCDLYVDGETYKHGPYGKDNHYEQSLVVKSDNLTKEDLLKNDVYEAVDFLLLEHKEYREKFENFLENPKDFIDFMVSFMYADLYGKSNTSTQDSITVNKGPKGMLGKAS